MFYYSKYIILIPDNYLHYYQRTNSIMHSFSKKHITDFFESNLDIRDFLKNQNCFEDYKDIFFSYFQRGCRSLLNTLFCVEQDPHIQKKYLLEFMKCMEKNFDIEELINNIDINLIKKIWGL